MDKLVIVLMATYNGEKYIREQLNSIMQQTYQHWKLYISDDCSTDHTYEICKEYSARYPDKVFCMKNKVASGNAKYNFRNLIQSIDIDDDAYYMFSDQDDFWLKDKIELTEKEMEINGNHDCPCLVYTDLMVVNEKLQVIDDSYFHFSHIMPKKSLRELVIQNTITGCTEMINSCLLRLLRNNCNWENICMHDWWTGLIAASMGKVIFLNKKTILYRQHSSNSVGAKKYGLRLFLSKRKTISSQIKNTYIQAKEFENTFSKDLNPKDIDLLKKYGSCLNKNKLYRLYVYTKYNIYKQGIERKVIQCIMC